MNLLIESSWQDFLKDEFDKDYFKQLSAFLEDEYNTKTIYPPKQLIFNAFNHCKLAETSVVLIGQDPYHGQNQAHGLSFSVLDGVPFPPSLKNIFKELHSDLGILPPFSGNLEKWATQGVLLLNATLTVQSKTPLSHQKKGWEEFTDAVIEKLNHEKEQLVFILWGAYAQKKGAKIDQNKHFVISAAHPSPFSAYNGFFGSKPFSKTNEYLVSIGKKAIEW
jgi:uracil-DNA glycosylase